MDWFRATLAVVFLSAMAPAALAEIDGHGPDSWRVTNVRVDEVLNARMGPGTNYPVIETFSDYESGLQQITCVPFYTAAHFMAMSEAEIAALPERWCLMRDAAMRKAGWVAQRFITPDNAEAAPLRATPSAAPPRATPRPVAAPLNPAAHDQRTAEGDAMIADATALVQRLYDANARAAYGNGSDPLHPATAGRYFTADIVALLRSGQIMGHPLYGAQDFDGTVTQVAPDPEQPMLRGMITVNVDFTNFGYQQRAVFYLRPDSSQSGAPLRIFSVDQEGWSYP